MRDVQKAFCLGADRDPLPSEDTAAIFDRSARRRASGAAPHATTPLRVVSDLAAEPCNVEEGSQYTNSLGRAFAKQTAAGTLPAGAKSDRPPQAAWERAPAPPSRPVAAT